MPALAPAAVTQLLSQLDDIQSQGGSGTLSLPGGSERTRPTSGVSERTGPTGADRLEVTNLGKVFWPALELTKGDLFRHYVRVAPFLLPILDGRPLVMKRYPNGVEAPPFYQHRAPDKLPPGVRVSMVKTPNEQRAHIVGGDLKTLLYTAQLASISQDPWFSRLDSLSSIDHVAIDLDPPDGLPYDKVLDVARWVREELDGLGATGFPKTSGSGGLHVYVPMKKHTPYEAGFIFAQIVATRVAEKHPKAATIERSVSARGRRIYVDYMQNVLGKTLASVYSPRANEFAGVSTPLTWDEVDDGVSPRDFTVANFASRIKAAGDLWKGLRTAAGVDLKGLKGNRSRPKTEAGPPRRSGAS